MTHLILTTDDVGAGSLGAAGMADIVLPFLIRFVWGPLPSDAELATFLEARSTKHGSTGSHWLDFVRPLHLGKIEGINLGLIAFWANVRIGGLPPKEIAEWRLTAVKILNEHLETASAAWQAYRAPTPEAWFNLLKRDLSLLSQLGPCVLELLEELPWSATGLGATEMRMLELISAGNARPFDVFPGHRKPNQRRVFEYWEVGSLLDGLARSPAPAVSGLDEGPFTLEMHDDANRFAQYKRSKLKLTELGKAILGRADDFSRHNPVDRCWGGTHLTNDRLWRWNQALMKP